MIKIDLSQTLTSPFGNPIPADDTGGEITIGAALVSHLIKSEQADPVKVFEWCRKLAKNQPLELDKSDADKFRKMCEGLRAPLMITGPVMEALMDQMKAE